MDTRQKDYTGPVPFEKHYEVFKQVEDKLKDHLSELEHEYFIAGLRVAYDEQDSSNEPGVLPYSVEFGYLGPLDTAIQCKESEELSDEELLNATKNAPISVELLDHYYAYIKESLEALTDTPLRVGIYIVLTGSSTLGYSSNCHCPNNKKLYCYYDPRIKDIRCYCTTRGC